METNNNDLIENSQIEEITSQNRGPNPYLVIFIAIIVLAYLYSLTFGESSISVMLKAKWKKEELLREYNALQQENQKLQKKHFELIQLSPTKDAF